LDKYYIGSTEDVLKRLKKHLENHKGSTASKNSFYSILFC
jgi:predicted GIY-YIG superfamily endonuclease